MNCTVCGTPHSKEQPLTIAHNGEWLCPGCLKELDSPGNGPLPGYLETFFKVGKDDTPPYGKSPIDVATESLYDNPGTGGTLRRSVVVGHNGKIKVGNLEIPIERFEMS